MGGGGGNWPSQLCGRTADSGWTVSFPILLECSKCHSFSSFFWAFVEKLEGPVEDKDAAEQDGKKQSEQEVRPFFLLEMDNMYDIVTPSFFCIVFASV